MDKAKIMRLIEDSNVVVNALDRQGANKDYKCKALREKLKAIAAEITAPPKSNADRIRQMTDEELAEWLDNEAGCNMCKKHPTQCDVDCYSGYLEWMRKEVDADAGTD